MRTLPLALASALLGCAAVLTGAAAKQPPLSSAATAGNQQGEAHPFREAYPQGFPTVYQTIYEPSPQITAAYQVVTTTTDTDAYDSAGLGAGDPLALDSDGDGALTPPEVHTFNEDNFKRHDIDGNGWLSPDEWTLTAQEHFGYRVNPAVLQTLTQDTFAEHDLDGDTRITRAEWDARIESEFALLDADRDGRIVPPEIARPNAQ